jgi:hypothetical protein
LILNSHNLPASEEKAAILFGKPENLWHIGGGTGKSSSGTNALSRLKILTQAFVSSPVGLLLACITSSVRIASIFARLIGRA